MRLRPVLLRMQIGFGLFVVFVASAAFAQPKDAISVYLTQASLGYSSSRGTTASAALAVSVERMLTRRVSGQLWIGTERHRTYSYIVVEPGGTFRDVPQERFRTYPVDAAVRYHFLNDSRWKPYIGAGARYVHAPDVSAEFRYSNRIGPEIVGGTAFQITRRFGLVADAKVYFGGREQYDSPVKTSFGLSWRF